MISSVLRHVLLKLIDLDDAAWIAFRRGLLMVVKGDTPETSRNGVRMMLAAIEKHESKRTRRSA